MSNMNNMREKLEDWFWRFVVGIPYFTVIYILIGIGSIFYYISAGIGWIVNKLTGGM